MNVLRKRNRGFTIIEILIALIILVAIISITAKGTNAGRKAALENALRVDAKGRMHTEIAGALLKMTPAQITAARNGRDMTEVLTDGAIGVDNKYPNDPDKAYKIYSVAAKVAVAAGEGHLAQDAVPAKFQIKDHTGTAIMAEFDFPEIVH
jgi:prepilin-type N-terminal cleavage/methylation domain-containing protein